MRTIRHHLAIGCAFAVVLASITVGCGSSSDATDASSDHARSYTIDHLKARMSAFTRLAPVYRSADELLGNVRFVRGGEEAQALTDAVVVGTIVDVAPGYGFADPATGATGERIGDGIQVPFDSEDALWRTVHLTLNVDEVLSGEIPNGTEQIRVGLAIGNVNTDEAHIRDGLKALDRTVWFLQQGSPVFAYDHSLYADIEDGRLIAQVTPDDRLAFPMLEQHNPSAAAMTDTSLAELREAARQPVRTVRLHQEDAVWTR